MYSFRITTKPSQFRDMGKQIGQCEKKTKKKLAHNFPKNIHKYTNQFLSKYKYSAVHVCVCVCPQAEKAVRSIQSKWKAFEVMPFLCKQFTFKLNMFSCIGRFVTSFVIVPISPPNIMQHITSNVYLFAYHFYCIVN